MCLSVCRFLPLFCALWNLVGTSLAYQEHIDLLQEISSSEETRREVKSEAIGLSKCLKELESPILLQLWNIITLLTMRPTRTTRNIILERMNKVSKRLQIEGLSLNNAVHLLKSLWGFVDSRHDRFDEFEKLGVELSGTSIYRNDQLRVRCRKTFFDKEMDISDTDDTEHSFREDFRVSAFLQIVNKLNSELSSRLEAYESLSGKFGFLSKLTELTPDELRAAASNLVMCYPDDLEQELESEIVHFAHHHHHSFNMSVPLNMGCMAAMFVLSFFLHSILFAGSALDSFQCLRSLLIVSFHVFFGLPRPRCPSTSNSVMLLIQPSFLTTCPNQSSRLYRNKVCMLLIPSFLRRESELMWSFKRILHVHRIIARSLRCSLSRSLTLGAQHSLAHNKTVRIYVLYICPRVMYERAREVNIGKSSRNLPHADRIPVITLKSQPPPALIVSPR